MNNEQVKAIQELAATLPQFHQTSMRKVEGGSLRMLGITEWHGQTVEWNKSYMVPVMKATNTVRRLTMLATNRGWEAMLEYVHRVRAGEVRSTHND